MALIAADGSWNVTVVNGATLTGIQAADGSYNVVQSTGLAPTGSMHPCGAKYVTVCIADQTTQPAADGSWKVSVSPYFKGTQRVTVVAGTFV